MSINIHLPKFEGPMALLLYLIRKEEMDIFDINIHDITRQYLDFIKLMKELDLEVAGEFVAMAATLIHIKSKMLLPQYNEKGEVVEAEDPRKELVQKLLEYQKFQEASRLLSERSLLGRDTWPRGVRESLFAQDEEIIIEDNALFSLIATYRRMLKSFNRKIHKVAAKAQSIASRILEIKDRLVPGHRVGLMDLVTGVENRARTALITFLSVLELAKMGFISLYQTENYSEIWIETKKGIENDVITRVEEYDSVHSESVADRIMAEPITDESGAISVAVVGETVVQIDEPHLEAVDGTGATNSLEEEKSDSSSMEGDFVLKDNDDFVSPLVESEMTIEEILASTKSLTADMELLALSAEAEDFVNAGPKIEHMENENPEDVAGHMENENPEDLEDGVV